MCSFSFRCTALGEHEGIMRVNVRPFGLLKQSWSYPDVHVFHHSTVLLLVLSHCSSHLTKIKVCHGPYSISWP